MSGFFVSTPSLAANGILKIMGRLSEQEQKIVKILQDAFNPKAIVLIGSRAAGTATEQSDWDVFLFSDERKSGVELQESNLTIDVNFSSWAKEDSYFDTGFGPVQPMKVLFDGSSGRLEKLITNTQAAYVKGPLGLQAEISSLNLRSFERYVEKLKKYENDEITQFYYKGMFLNKFLVVWFEQQNIWAPAPVKALAILKNTETRIFELIHKLLEHSGAKATLIVEELQNELYSKSR